MIGFVSPILSLSLPPSDFEFDCIVADLEAMSTQTFRFLSISYLGK